MPLHIFSTSSEIYAVFLKSLYLCSSYCDICPVADYLSNAIALRQTLHRIPEKSFEEKRTKETLMNYIREHSTLEVIDRGAWFYALWKGEGQPIAFRAEMDAVSDGGSRFGHFCGHDGHCATLAGFAELISQRRPDRTIYLIFQPAEEIGKGAELCAELIEEAHIEEIYAYHNIPGYREKSVLLAAGTFACASTGMEIRITGTPSHAAYPEDGRNPALVISKLVIYLDELVKQPHSGVFLGTVVGIDLGNDSYGVSASKGILRLTLRAEHQDEFSLFVQDIETRARELCYEEKLECSVALIEEFSSTENDPDCVEKLRLGAKNRGLDSEELEGPFRWSEDFGYYLKKTKGAIFGIGAGESCPQLHTSDYEYPDSIMKSAIEMFASIIGEKIPLACRIARFVRKRFIK